MVAPPRRLKALGASFSTSSAVASGVSDMSRPRACDLEVDHKLNLVGCYGKVCWLVTPEYATCIAAS
jgi:hypothetical protein